MSLYFGCVLFSLPVLLIYLLGATKHLFNQEGNTCGMTYMFEKPQYVEEIQKEFPRYGLYAYGEGFTLSRIRAMRFSGIPVLFIPGNAGSHHQVRSLASVSLRKSLENQVPFHFDFFTVDLHGEYSALYGGKDGLLSPIHLCYFETKKSNLSWMVERCLSNNSPVNSVFLLGVLAEQMEFVSHCIQRLLKFYVGKIDSVILIGHSMGGIVSKGVLLEPTMNISQVNTIIMLATPHTPALVLDTSVAAIYQKLQESEKLFKESEMITVSVGSGPGDVVVNSNQIMDVTADLNILTTQIPDVWRTTDHLSILWCKEFVLTVIRALFDSVDATGKYSKISANREHRLKVFNYHFLQRSGSKKMREYQTKVQFEPGGEWIEDIRRQYTWKAENQTKANNKSQIYLMIRLIGRQDRLTIQTMNLDARDWLFACSASAIQGYSRVCEWGWNLTNKTRISPDGIQRKKIVDLDLEELKARRLTHVVIRVPFTHYKKGLSIGVDLHQKSDRLTELKNKFNPIYSGFGKLGAVESSNGAIRYEVNLENNTDSVWLKLHNVECNQRNHRHRATIELLEKWTNEISQVKLFTYQDMTAKVLKVQTLGEVNGVERVQNVSLKLKFTFDPECTYIIEVWHGGFMETLASAVRDRWSNLYGVIVGLLLLALAKQVDYDIGFINSTTTAMATLVLCFGIDIGPEGFVALAILHLFAALVCCTVVFFGSTVYNLANRFLARALKFSFTWSDWVLGGLNQLPLLTATILLSIVPISCGALAMWLFIALQFLKLIKLYEDYLEQLLLASFRFSFIKKFGERRKKQNYEEQKQRDNRLDEKQIWFQLVLFLVWCAAAIPAIPSVLVWAKNYRYNTTLITEDPYLMICWMVLVGFGSAGITWVPPNSTGYYSREIATVLRLLGWTALTITGVGYPCQYQYLMPSLIAVAIGLLAIRPIIGLPDILRQ